MTYNLPRLTRDNCNVIERKEGLAVCVKQRCLIFLPNQSLKQLANLVLMR